MDQIVQKELDIIKESVLKTVPAVAIYLFGSYAYGTPDADSDIDIYVVVPDNAEDLIELRAGIRMNLQKKRSRDLDLLIGRSSVFNERKEGPTLERIIARDGVRLHG
jgi:predicted nucleotidyltransferase